MLRSWPAWGLAVAALVAPGVRAATCPPGPNLADRDGNGAFDYACAGDWNADGACQMEDIQAAVDALTDPGDKLVEVGECSFEPPLVAHGDHGILELPSHTTLRGQGPTTVLNGFPTSDLVSIQAVITNADPRSGDTGVHIENLLIDGGWHAGDATPIAHHFRMGVFFDACSDCSASGLVVRDTLHSCFYSRDGRNIEFRDSRLERCGNYGGLGETYSCVYLYARAAHEQRFVNVSGIDCDGSGWSALNTRREDATAILSDIVFRDNTVRNTAVVDGVAKLCILIRGVARASYLNNLCIDTGGLETLNAASYYSEGLDAGASTQIEVDGLTIRRTIGRSGMHVQSRTEDFQARNVHVEDAGRDCLEVTQPQRGFVLEDSTFAGCGLRGIHEFGAFGSGDGPDEGLTFRRLAIQDVGLAARSDAVSFAGPMRGLLMEGVSLREVRGRGMVFGGGLEQSSVVGCTIEGAATGGLQIANGAHGVTIDDNLLRDFAREAPATGRGIEIAGASSGVAIAGNRLEALTTKAQYGIHFEGPGEPPAGLCDNTCAGMLGVDRCLHVVGHPEFGSDLDFDALADACDVCPIDPGNDADADGLCAGTDNCAQVPNADQADVDLDGVGDVCDRCPAAFDPLQQDTDLDGVGDACENCPATFNPSQSDRDDDGQGDACDLDDGAPYLRWPERERLLWEPEESFDAWNVYRGDLAELRAGGVYTQAPGSNEVAGRSCGLDAAPLEEPFEPPSGALAFYLVTGVAGPTEGTLGEDASGAPRPNANPCGSNLASRPRPNHRAAGSRPERVGAEVGRIE